MLGAKEIKEILPHRYPFLMIDRVEEVEEGKITKDEIDEKTVSDNLYTAGLEDPNLIIRTSGEERLSGFLLWQSSYSELYFCDSLWPELRKVDFLRAIRDYQQRERRYGT